MTTLVSPILKLQNEAFGMHEGWSLLSGYEAILKGILESELDVALLSMPANGAFDRLLRLAGDPGLSQVLREHGVRLVGTDDAPRALELALLATRESKRTVACIPNGMLDASMGTLSRIVALPLTSDGAMALLLEDDPASNPASCPRQAAFRLGMPCLEATDHEHVRDIVDVALRLSKAGSGPVAIVVQRLLLNASDTLRMRPNRVVSRVDAPLLARKRKQRPRWGEAGGVMRIARRLEVNRGISIPSPGERVPVGFIVVGPATSALHHVIHIMRLVGRVPVLALAMLNPIDESAIERLLGRCEQVVVLEPRPRSVEGLVVTVAEVMRRNGETPATVWGSTLPMDEEQRSMRMDILDATHPSILARRIVHLLHRIRPTLEVASHLLEGLPSQVNITLPQRGAGFGVDAAIQRLRAIFSELAPRLSDEALLEQHNAEATSLLLFGNERFGVGKRSAPVEIWRADQLLTDGLAAIRHAARSELPRIAVILVLDDEPPSDIERLASAAIPSERALRTRVRRASLGDVDAFSELMLESVFSELFTVVVVTDGPVMRYNPAAIERTLREVDRLGFSPVQAGSWPAEHVCDLHPSAMGESPMSGATRELKVRRGRVLVETSKEDDSQAGVFRIVPMLELVEVVRTKAPMIAPRLLGAARLTAPPPIHARASEWRCHCAGWRGETPGVVPMVLASAGRRMGYHVRVASQPTPTAPGWRAYAQVLFTRISDVDAPLPLSGIIPYGEADLLLGVDPVETLRAIEGDDRLRIAHRDRTHAVINSAVLSTDNAMELPRNLNELLESRLADATRENPRLLADVAATARKVFHSDRVVDLMLLGAAFQAGLVPATIEALEAALREAEAFGYGRALEVFRLGRVLMTERALLDRANEQRIEPVKRITRRMAVTVRKSRPGGTQKARRFARLVERMLTSTPGLAETEPGREAMLDAVQGVYHCFLWGGLPYAELYVDRLVRLYDVDRGDRGRMLTRLAALPLAEAMLIRDHLHIASMAMSIEHRRQIRQQLNIRKSRGDRIDRRYVTRIIARVFGKQFSVDVRTSDWPARLMSRLAPFVPLQMRGTSEQRAVRQALYDLIDRIIESAGKEYGRHVSALLAMHELAKARAMTLEAVRAVLAAEQPALATPIGERASDGPADAQSATEAGADPKRNRRSINH